MTEAEIRASAVGGKVRLRLILPDSTPERRIEIACHHGVNYFEGSPFADPVIFVEQAIRLRHVVQAVKEGLSEIDLADAM